MALRTAPPHAAVASGSHHFRRQTAVQVLRPLCSYLGFPRREVIEAWQCTPSGAVRAAAALAAGAYTRTIFVPDGTAPPHAAITVFRHVLRRERTVALAVPFGGEPGVDARKIVFPRIYSFAGAVRAAAPSCAGADLREPDMVFTAAPPDLAPAARRNVRGRKRAVEALRPLGGQLWECSGERVVLRGYGPLCAIWAAAAAGAHYDVRTPFMPFGASPPGPFVAAWQDRLRPEAAVFFPHPLFHELRIERGEVVDACFGYLSGTDRAMRAACAARYRRFPGVAPFTAPPGFALAAVADVLRRERRILIRVPFSKQAAFCFKTMIVERFAPGILLSIQPSIRIEL